MKKHCNHRIPLDNHKNQENLRIPFDNLENHENLKMSMRITKITKNLEFY